VIGNVYSFRPLPSVPIIEEETMQNIRIGIKSRMKIFLFKLIQRRDRR